MTERPSQRRWAIKTQAKQTFFRFLRPCLISAFFLITLSLLARIFSLYSGGMLFYGFLDIQQFPVGTGIWRADSTAMTNLLALFGLESMGSMGGLVFAIRYEATGQVFVLPVAWRQAMEVVLIQSVVLLVTTPLQYGVLRQYHRILEGCPQRPRYLFGWYLDMRLTGKALAVQVVLTVWRFLTAVLCALPGLFCGAVGTMTPHGETMLLMAPGLAVAGLLVSYYLYILLLPARYVLAKDPECSVPQAFSRGLSLLSGRQREYFALNLSFLPWHICAFFLYGVPNLFIIPYVELSNFLFLDPPEPPERL